MGLAMPLVQTPSPTWRAGPLEARLAALHPGLRVEVVAQTASTSTDLVERARAGDMRPVLRIAERQTAGRGRMGRPWSSEAASLTFSLGLPLAPGSGSGLSLAVGVAIAEALDPLEAGAEPRVRLKWPNDLWLGTGEHGPGRKFGGVLIETISVGAARHAVIGIGLNLDAPAGIEPPAAGWREAEPAIDAPSMLARVAPALLAALHEFESAGFAAFAARYARRDALAGRTVSATTVPPCSGRADGVDAEGALRLVAAQGLLRIASGEVSIRPLAPDASTPC